jgi:predicted  nucleic acid-binding Zn-ribbon protein
MSQRLETVQSYNDTLEKEISETREQVARLSAQLNDGQDITLKSQNEKTKIEVQVVDLQQNLTLLKDEKTRI